MRRVALAVTAIALLSPFVRAAEPGKFGYGPDNGPANWAKLEAGFAECGSGTRQSPIDIDPRNAIKAELPPLQLNYGVGKLTTLDPTDNTTIDRGGGNFVTLGGKRFILEGLHFHHPSEHSIGGQSFPLEAHLVHKSADAQIAVIGVLIKSGKADPGIAALPDASHPKHVSMLASALIPQDRTYWTYNGSLTTPPCTEGVRWIVMRNPIEMSPEQIQALTDSLDAIWHGPNARPVQHANGRFVLR
ncbi:MAG TPA: carbonic anhydrase family protein [Candidatus Binataceae bacterium]